MKFQRNQKLFFLCSLLGYRHDHSSTTTTAFIKSDSICSTYWRTCTLVHEYSRVKGGGTNAAAIQARKFNTGTNQTQLRFGSHLPISGFELCDRVWQWWFWIRFFVLCWVLQTDSRIHWGRRRRRRLVDGKGRNCQMFGLFLAKSMPVEVEWKAILKLIEQ